MGIHKYEEKDLISWGLKFFELGYNSAFENIDRIKDFTRDVKVDVIKKYIEKELAEEIDQ